MNTESLIDFPILNDELDLGGGFFLQRRLSSCGSRGALTMKMREFVTWVSALDSPFRELADCVKAVQSELAARDPDQNGSCRDLHSLDAARDGISDRAREVTRTLAEARARVMVRVGSDALAGAREAIANSRKTMLDQRQTMANAEAQISRCEKCIVLSSYQTMLGDPTADRAPHPTGPSEQEIQEVLSKRSMIREEQRTIHETEISIIQAAAALPDR